jgi:sugar phosphate isomerase/epimerase
MYTRRDIGRMALAAPLAGLALAKIDSTVKGVMLGAQSYSFRQLPDISVDGAIKAFQECGLGYCELWQGHLEPKDTAKAAEWRKNPPLDEIRAARKKFDAAGIVLYALNYSFRENFTDPEIENGFKIAQALGIDKITASSNVSTAKRIDPLAQKYKIYVGMHNHSNLRENEFARPEDFAAAMKGMSKYIAINLDIGHFTAAGYDPVQYLEQHHDHILTLHIKDRKKNQGANMVFGEGDTDIKGVLNVLKTKKYKIPAMIEYEYKGTSDPITEVKKCYEYLKQALA